MRSASGSSHRKALKQLNIAVSRGKEGEKENESEEEEAGGKEKRVKRVERMRRRVAGFRARSPTATSLRLDAARRRVRVILA
eukprot:5444102-Pleurochrysis_carterae.AAC.2